MSHFGLCGTPGRRDSVTMGVPRSNCTRRCRRFTVHQNDHQKVTCLIKTDGNETTMKRKYVHMYFPDVIQESTPVVRWG